jgi:hypothetical protein
MTCFEHEFHWEQPSSTVTSDGECTNEQGVVCVLGAARSVNANHYLFVSKFDKAGANKSHHRHN